MYSSWDVFSKPTSYHKFYIYSQSQTVHLFYQIAACVHKPGGASQTRDVKLFIQISQPVWSSEKIPGCIALVFYCKPIDVVINNEYPHGNMYTHVDIVSSSPNHPIRFTPLRMALVILNSYRVDNLEAYEILA